MHQVLRNLISNALKFSPEGSDVTVTASFRPLHDRPSPSLTHATPFLSLSLLSQLRLKPVGGNMVMGGGVGAHQIARAHHLPAHSFIRLFMTNGFGVRTVLI